MKKLNKLMSVRVCDLKLNLKRSHLYSRVRKLYRELEAKRIRFKPECYFADEWFVPEGDPVIGIPFYLANKDLMKLEKKMIGEAEGDRPQYFMKLLRHETGHAISYAYKIHRKKSYQKIFGHSSELFSDLYRFNRRSKKHVLHLEDHYAQSHPDEDFAETFAVWLAHPKKTWKKKYKNWGARKKLEFVDEILTDIQNKPARVKKGTKMCHVSSLKYTLWTYYMRRRSLLEHHTPSNLR